VAPQRGLRLDFRGVVDGVFAFLRARRPAYTAGLLHDIGRLGLFVPHPREYARFDPDPATMRARIAN